MGAAIGPYKAIGPDLRSIKVEVKKKHISCGWNFSSFAAPLNEQDLF